MSQISRPFQIGLALVSVLALAWFLVLRLHQGAPGVPAPSAAQPSPAATPTQAAGGTATKAGPPATPVGPARRVRHATPIDPAAQVADELVAGDVVVVLFWNPYSAADQEAHREVEKVARDFKHVDVHLALPSQVTQYGTVAQNITVLDTPTIEVIAPSGAVTTLGAPTDMTIIGQAIADARNGFQAAPVQRFASLAPGSARSKFVAAANRICRDEQRRLGISLTGEPPAGMTVSEELDAAADALGGVERLPMPAADRGYLLTQLHTDSHAIALLRQARSPSSATQAVSLAQQGIADDDAASTALADYGLTDCETDSVDLPAPTA